MELRKFHGRVEVQEDTLRIKWEAHTNGLMSPKPDSLQIRADFNDRLHSGDVPDLQGYENYLANIHHNLPIYLSNEYNNLRFTEGKYFDHLTEKAGEQKPMLELLDEYIAALPPDEKRPTGEQVINTLKELEETER